jgi:hypothetical protein
MPYSSGPGGVIPHPIPEVNFLMVEIPTPKPHIFMFLKQIPQRGGAEPRGYKMLNAQLHIGISTHTKY